MSTPPLIPFGLLRGVIRDAICLTPPCPDGPPGGACASCTTDNIMRALVDALGGES